MPSTDSRRTIFHPATAVVLWLFFMVLMTWLTVPGLAVMTVILLPGFVSRTRQQFSWYVRRSRWLLLILLLVHAYSLPGPPLWVQLGKLGPSLIGLSSGLIQTWRLLLILASLAILMTHLTRESLLSGLYRIVTPLRYLGFPPERLAVRIWLTMRYAEGLMHEHKDATFKQRIAQLFCLPALAADALQPLILPDDNFNWIDYACLFGALALGIWLKLH